jgi:4-carboxymuconolactone decarboxylase
MIPRPRTPRLTPVPYDELNESQLAVLPKPPAAGGTLTAANLLMTLVRHPNLMRAWIPFSLKLFSDSCLPDRDRELLILRTGWRCRSSYEWGQHVLIARSIGLSDEDFTLLQSNPLTADADPWDLVLLDAADELHDDACIGEPTWTALASRYDVMQLIEVPMVVGGYHQLSYLLNSVGVSPDESIRELETGF